MSNLTVRPYSGVPRPSPHPYSTDTTRASSMLIAQVRLQRTSEPASYAFVFSTHLTRTYIRVIIGQMKSPTMNVGPPLATFRLQLASPTNATTALQRPSGRMVLSLLVAPWLRNPPQCLFSSPFRISPIHPHRPPTILAHHSPLCSTTNLLQRTIQQRSHHIPSRTPQHHTMAAIRHHFLTQRIVKIHIWTSHIHTAIAKVIICNPLAMTGGVASLARSRPTTPTDTSHTTHSTPLTRTRQGLVRHRNSYPPLLSLTLSPLPSTGCVTSRETHLPYIQPGRFRFSPPKINSRDRPQQAARAPDSPVLVQPNPFGAGSILCYNSSDSKMYRWSGSYPARHSETPHKYSLMAVEANRVQ